MLSSQLLEGVDVMAAVVDTRSFNGAAEVLHMSQSGVSRAVARLEARLGIRIFDAHHAFGQADRRGPPFL